MKIRVGTVGVLLVVVSSLCALSAQSTPFLAAPAERGVVLRWVWGEGARPAGYFVERRAAGGPWTRLNARPITRTRDRAAGRARLGDRFERLQGLLFPDDPRAERADPETYRGMLLLMADLEPGAAHVLGLRYDDVDATTATTYEYRLVALTDGGERLEATSQPVVAGGYRTAPPPEAVNVVISPRGAALRWSTAARYSGYHVYRGSRRDGADARRVNQTPVIVFLRGDGAPVEISTSFFTDSAPPVRDSTFYMVEGIDAFGRASRRSAPAPFVWRDLTAPAPPLGVQARVAGDTVVVTWTPQATGPTAAGFQLWRADATAGPWVKLGSRVAPAVREQRDAGRPARRLSWYRVTAVDAAGHESDPSAMALAEVPDLAPPSVPAGLVGAADTGRLTLRWRRVAAADLRGYRVYRAGAPDGTSGLLTSTPQRDTVYADTIPMRADHPFYYHVTAVDSAFNESAASIVLAVRPPDVTPPSAPRIAALRPLDAALGVTWLANPEPDVVAYRVRFRVRGESTWQEVPAAVPAGVLADTIAGLAPGRSHEVTLVAVDDAGNRSLPAPVLVGTPVRRRAVGEPELRRAAYERSARGAVIEWSRPAGEITAVTVLRRQDDQAWRPVAELPATTTRFVDRTVRAGQQYEYALRVRDGFGNSADSRVRRVTLPAAGS